MRRIPSSSVAGAVVRSKEIVGCEGKRAEKGGSVDDDLMGVLGHTAHAPAKM